MPIGTLTEFFAKAAPKVSKIIPIGEVSFLFMFQTSDDMTCMIMNQPEWVHLLFSSFREWKEGDAAVDRLCWVLVRGVPPKFWTEDFFRVTTSCVGKMVDWSTQTKSRSRMDVAEIFILTKNMEFINKILFVKIGNYSYKVGIFQTQFDPLHWDQSSPLPCDEILSSFLPQKSHEPAKSPVRPPCPGVVSIPNSPTSRHQAFSFEYRQCFTCPIATAITVGSVFKICPT
ncbi:hypothetical protein Tsubulata_041794 [Turnera subulata]|uniref:DUF4283 domain-containing protein n=1 Tax=Turnera subulata TaxID=218843 RepID=A0A9Q0JM15_9ROSI|nr:hypothetical protein Tsubulata_041794 [Turnera subulata]